MEYIKKEFIDDDILLMYRCGSRAFGTSTGESDNDYVVVLRDFKGTAHRANGKDEYFVFGLSAWKRKMEFSDYYDEYLEAHNDEIMAFPNNVICIDDSMKKNVEDYKKSFTGKMKTWLKKVCSHYEFILGLEDLSKSLYHLVRIRSIVERYKATGSFSLELDDNTLAWILDYKKASNREPFKRKIKETFEYLKKEAAD